MGLILSSNAQSEETKSIGYPNVKAALEAVTKKKNAQISKQDGWTVVALPNEIQWTFTPNSHEAHPSAAKRRLYKKDGAWRVETLMYCEASKKSCDSLRTDFNKLDDSLKKYLSKQ